MLLIKNCEILQAAPNNQFELTKGDIAISDGNILYVGHVPESFKSERIINAEGKLAIPGLINAHTHSYANLLKGLVENLPLEPWMYYAFLAGIMDEEDVYASTMLGCLEMIKTGATACIDHIAYNREGLDSALNAYVESGMRVAMAPMVSDLPYYKTLPIDEHEIPIEIFHEMNQSKVKSAAEIIELCREVIENWHFKNEGLITIMLGPSGPQRCSQELLIDLVKLARQYNLGIHTHFVETKIQSITALKRYNLTMGEYLDQLDVIDDRWSLAHSVWVSDKEIELLASKGPTVVHNPASNLSLGSGISPINKFKKSGVPLALGTDGCNCGGNQSMFGSMSLAAMLSKVTTPNHEEWQNSTDILMMATRGGARALRMEDQLGSIESGKKADLVLLDLDSSYLTPRVNLVNQLVYSETGQSVDTVIIQGKVIMEGKVVQTFNEKKVLDLVQKRFENLKEKIEMTLSRSKKQMAFIDEIYKREATREIDFHRSVYWS
jgi:5-methylthioadenosine/S-adenosylhomocysteine deaminase